MLSDGLCHLSIVVCDPKCVSKGLSESENISLLYSLTCVVSGFIFGVGPTGKVSRKTLGFLFGRQSVLLNLWRATHSIRIFWFERLSQSATELCAGTLQIKNQSTQQGDPYKTAVFF